MKVDTRTPRLPSPVLDHVDLGGILEIRCCQPERGPKSPLERKARHHLDVAVLESEARVRVDQAGAAFVFRGSTVGRPTFGGQLLGDEVENSIRQLDLRGEVPLVLRIREVRAARRSDNPRVTGTPDRCVQLRAREI